MLTLGINLFGYVEYQKVLQFSISRRFLVNIHVAALKSGNKLSLSRFFHHNLKIGILKIEIRKLKNKTLQKSCQIYLRAMKIKTRLETNLFSHEIKILTLSCTQEVNLGLDAV